MLETPAGQAVGSTFFATLLRTWNLGLALADANRVAALPVFQIVAVIDGLRIIGALALANRHS